MTAPDLGPTRRPPRFWLRPSAEPPLTVELAFWLTVAQPAVNLLTPPLPAFATLPLWVIVNLIVLWIAWLSRAGANWARILRTIGLALGVVSWILVVVGVQASSTSGPEFVPIVVNYALDIAAIVLLWRPASNAYFRAVAAEKRQFREAMLR